jgi:hypothetical protein
VPEDNELAGQMELGDDELDQEESDQVALGESVDEAEDLIGDWE